MVKFLATWRSNFPEPRNDFKLWAKELAHQVTSQPDLTKWLASIPVRQGLAFGSSSGFGSQVCRSQIFLLSMSPRVPNSGLVANNNTCVLPVR